MAKKKHRRGSDAYRFATHSESRRIWAASSDAARMTNGIAKPIDGVHKFRFTCHRCGKCCSSHLTTGDVLTPVEVGILTDVTAQMNLPPPDDKKLPINGKGACLWYHPEQGCLVYPVRPSVCRLFPMGALPVYWERVIALAILRKRNDGTGCPGREDPTSTKWMAGDYYNSIWGD
jgi:Fe-S-cluster containining protein